MESLNETFVLGLFIVTSVLAVVMKLIKWFKREKTDSSWLTSLQIRYFVCYYSFMTGLNFQGPYVYQRYLDAGIDQAQINMIMSSYNIVNSFWGFAVGYFTELLGHKKLIIISALLLGLHAFLRYIGGFWCFVAASAVMGVSTASNKVVFEDWLMEQLQSGDAPGLAQATIQENSALIRLLLTLILTPVSDKVTKTFGSSSAFLTSCLMFISSSIIIAFTMSDSRSQTQKKKFGYLGALKFMKDAIRNSNELLVMLVIDFAFSVFSLLYAPRWLAIHQVDKKERLPLSQMSSTTSVAFMNGAQLFGAILQLLSAKTCQSVGFTAYLVSIVAILVLFANKNLVYPFYLLAAICEGGMGTVMRITRGAIYPKEVRGYILGLIRVPTSLCISALLFLLRGHSVERLLVTSLSFLCAASGLSFVLTFQRNRFED